MQHRSRQLGRTLLAAASALLVSGAVPAGAEVPDQFSDPQISGFAGINSAFAEHLPAATSRARLCLVDTGVNANADTATVAVRSVVAEANYDGSGHGTDMAMALVGVENDFGGQGLWAPMDVLAVDAMQTGSAGLRLSDVQSAMRLCLAEGAKVIVLAMASASSPGFAQTVADAAAADALVVVAAGNTRGGAVAPLALTEGVLAVGASQGDGDYAEISARGEGIDLLAPGAELDLAAVSTNEGSSYAAAYVGGAAALLRSYAPQLSAEQTRQLLLASARPVRAGALLDVASAFRAAGLAALVDAALSVKPPVVAAPQAVRARYRDQRLRVVARVAPSTSLVVEVPDVNASWQGRGGRVSAPVRRPRSVLVKAVDGDGNSSPSVRVRVR